VVQEVAGSNPVGHPTIHSVDFPPFLTLAQKSCILAVDPERS
jgi:hypothetical protein